MTSKCRVLYIEKPPFVGGSITSLFELVRGLDRTRFEPLMLFCGPNPFRARFEEIGVPTAVLSETIPPMGRNQRDIAGTLGRVSQPAARTYTWLKDLYRFARRDYPVARQVARLIDQWGIDVVHHNNCLYTDRATVLAARLARRAQIVHVRSLRPFGGIERTLSRTVNAFVYVSRAVEAHYRRLGIPATQGKVIYEGFAPHSIRDATGTQQSDLRASLGLRADDRVISNVGRIEWWKGHDYFIQSLAALVPHMPNTRALVVGAVDSTMRNTTYHAQLQALVQQLGLDEHVIFTGFHAEVAAIMAMSDVVVHSASEPEPFGRVVVEAMLAGRPVVATAAGGVLDIVEDNVTGLTVPPKDAAVMAGAIQYLLQNPTTAHSMGQRARQAASTRFSIEQHVAGIQELYASVSRDSTAHIAVEAASLA